MKIFYVYYGCLISLVIVILSFYSTLFDWIDFSGYCLLCLSFKTFA